MTTLTAPSKIARWLLSHFGCSPNNDAVIGDLDERYRQTRSAVWYCKQAALAIATGAWSEIRSHKLQTVGAVAAGWVTVFTFGMLLIATIEGVRSVLFVVLGSPAMWEPTGLGDLNRYFQIQPRVFQAHIPWSFFLAVFTLTVCVTYAIAGAVVARLNQRRYRTMVLAFVASQVMLVMLTFRHSDNVLLALPGLISTLWGAGLLDRHSNSSNKSISS